MIDEDLSSRSTGEPGADGDDPPVLAGDGWVARAVSQSDGVVFVVPGGGGCGVVEMDGETLFQFIAEFPFGPYSTITTEPVVDGDWSLKTQIAVVEQMMAQMSPA
ncbi:MAG: hypothetical protein U0556_07025 [Dehalococcoidia bacterium]